MTQGQLHHQKAYPSIGDKSAKLHLWLLQHDLQLIQLAQESPFSQPLFNVLITFYNLGKYLANFVSVLASKLHELLSYLERKYFSVEKIKT